jgi:hypothetical protein
LAFDNGQQTIRMSQRENILRYSDEIDKTKKLLVKQQSQLELPAKFINGKNKL